jgi:hypothetical protein
MREMTADDIGIGKVDLLARSIVADIFDDLRDRKFLKYLFDSDPDNCGAYGYVDAALDLEIQREIANTWQELIAERVRAALKDTPNG